MTVPVTTASAERSFLRLKLIKNLPQNNNGKGRLTGLAILSVENDVAGLFRNLGFIQFQKNQ
jgi:hypothetical protein